MRLEYIVDSFESNLRDLKKTQAKIEVLQNAFRGFDERYNLEYAARREAYPYIPVDLGEYIDNLLDLDACLRVDPAYKAPPYRNPDDPEDKGPPYRPISFLEVGCGLARNLFVTIHGSQLPLKEVRGFDISPEYIEQARQFFFLGEQVEVGDALTYDYSRFDVVYFARPFHDETLECQFEKRLIAQLRPGAYIMSYLASLLSQSKALEAMDMFGRLWRKKPSGQNGQNGHSRSAKTSRKTAKTRRQRG